METADAVVIGAGPAGFFAAIHAAQAGARVVLLEKNQRPGAKILLAGSGQCNITHEGDIRGFLDHYGDHGKFVKPALMSFSNKDLVRFFKERRLPSVCEENGKIFPATRKSSDVLDVLLAAARAAGVAVRCGEPVTGIRREGGAFVVTTPAAEYRAGSAVIATGGASYPSCGTTGDGYRLASLLGQQVTTTGPALAPLIIRPFPFADLAGISFEMMPFTIWRNGKKTGDFQGDVLVTHLGLSGPGILDASRWICPGDIIRLSFVRTMRREEFAADLAGKIAARPASLVGTVLGSYPIPDRLARRLLELAGIQGDLRCAHLPAALRSALAGACTEFPLTVSDVGGFAVAMATRGGVALEDVNAKTMESRTVPGLFFAGEVLDIDGDTGGYNLQAAFSTGYLAGITIGRKDRKADLPHHETAD